MCPEGTANGGRFRWGHGVHTVCPTFGTTSGGSGCFVYRGRVRGEQRMAGGDKLSINLPFKETLPLLYSEPQHKQSMPHGSISKTTQNILIHTYIYTYRIYCTLIDLTMHQQTFSLICAFTTTL